MWWLMLLMSLSAKEILAKVDSVMNAPKDETAEMVIVTIDSRGMTKERKATLMQKGEKRLIKFSYPLEDRGISFLSLSEDEMYVYLPSFKRVTRIASHVKNSQFLDTDLSYEEMGKSTYKQEESEILEENEKQYRIKSKSNFSGYDYIIVTIDKQSYIPVTIEFQKAGVTVKVMEMANITKVGKYNIPLETRVKNIKDNHKTIMRIEKIDLDRGLTDEEFTLRKLKGF